MENKENEIKQGIIIPSVSDEKGVKEYVDNLIMLLDKKKICTETIKIAINGIDFDQGVNFVDTFLSLDKKNVQDSWKLIRESDNFKDNKDNKALKLVCALAASALCGEGNASLITGNILTGLVVLLRNSKKNKLEDEEKKIIKEFVFDSLTKDTKLPEWKSLKMTPESALLFCEIIENVVALNDNQSNEEVVVKNIVSWIKDIKNQAEEAKELKDREKNKPTKKSDVLQELADHYRKLETELDKYIAENVSLTLEKKKLNEKIYEIEDEKSDLKKQVESLNHEINDLNNKIIQANQEVEERKRLNDAQVQYREASEVSLLQDIARALKAEYGDYIETKDAPMNTMLGEIYREKLKQVFKILDQNGIKVEE